MCILITGVAGFIGSSVARQLCQQGLEVVGIDNLNDYYSPQLKQDRLSTLKTFPQFTFYSLDIADSEGLNALFRDCSFTRVIHLAAQAGVRYSIDHPQAYTLSNLVGFMNILEACRHHQIAHLLFASSSSVYGNQKKVPFSETDTTDSPVSLYAATKKANELLAYSYSHLYQLPVTGLRFFTVYGPWGRPDMAPWLFTRAILENRPIKVFNHGQLKRDFTYIDDIVSGVNNVLAMPPVSLNSAPPYAIYNIGNNQPVKLLDFIACIERACGKPAKLEMLEMQPGDVYQTCADITALQQKTGFAPQTPLEQGIREFVDWYRHYADN
ncbi:NAD-dependent epimerase [Lacimicrobium alkaliphilum]|uniref:NAD-dependent epimerase n=1 Tax=Lacimicrobium alkaliphilum TaxID=1526571 RepID=A0ABQ1RHM5_9ALTE|nr:NAD-dependent epimerase [Lacimicrobium alkaliphilum]GGD68693.1 NAD-dependent epimerase [Lacimicrobium alkaliphilum]